ncbi:MAG: DUF4062 domain-containing protein [Candidatus Cloacimonetes bacterium]|nr:DUF4062 domain-containing protein [Candidatus Cloacimonadota bacterium]
MNKDEQTSVGFKAWRTFSIFISSTFIDMQAERDHLKNIVFPRVEEELRKNRIRLETVDLRWGVDTSDIMDEAEREVKVLQVCLEEIKRCRPFFIGLLGDRYGWIPPEERMKDAIRKETNLKHKNDKSVTALEIEFGVLASEEQLSRSVFYFRDPLPYDTFPVNIASKYSDEYDPKLTVKEKSERKTALDNLKAEIRDHFKKKNLENKVKTYAGKWDVGLSEVVNLDAWGEMVYEDIIRECMAQAEITKDKVAKNVYEQEVLLLDAFIEDHTSVTTIKTGTTVEEVQTFCGRIELLRELKEHLLNADAEKWGLVLTGDSGSGKSAVFSMIYRMLQREDCILLANSAGISPRSGNVAHLLQKWNRQLSKRLGLAYEAEISPTAEFDLEDLFSEQIEKKPAIEELQQIFKELLFTAAENYQVVILIDALDRFETTSRAINMTWLPRVMPGKVRMLCTAITGTEVKAVHYHRQLIPRSIDHFTQEEAEAMLEMLCRKQHKDMPLEVKNIILNKRRDSSDILARSSPLWLSLAVNVIMAMDNEDFDRIREKEGRVDLGINDHMLKMVMEFPSFPGELFLSLVKKAAGYFGKEFTEKVFDYLSCSRNGLRESDLEKLIPVKDEKWDALTFTHIRRWFSAYIRNDGKNKQWNLVHTILRNSLQDSITSSDELKRINAAIASHLLSLPENDDLKISETMYHLMIAEKAEKALDYYINCSPAESKGATTVLAEAISNDDKNLVWCFEILKATVGNKQKFLRLAPKYIIDLDNDLEVEGNLITRQKLFQTLYIHFPTQKNFSNHTTLNFYFAEINGKLGDIFESLHILNQALAFYKKCLMIFQKLFDSNPDNESHKRGLAISYFRLGNINESLGNLIPSLEFYNKCNHLMKEIYEINPGKEELKRDLAISFMKLGTCNKSLGNKEYALRFFGISNNYLKELYDINPKDEIMKRGLAISYMELGEINQSLENHDLALEFYNKCNHLMKELYERNPLKNYVKSNLAISYAKIAGIYKLKGNLIFALQNYIEHNIMTNELYIQNPEQIAFLAGLAYSYYYISVLYKEIFDDEQGKKYFLKWKEIVKILNTSLPNTQKDQTLFNKINNYEDLPTENIQYDENTISHMMDVSDVQYNLGNFKQAEIILMKILQSGYIREEIEYKIALCLLNRENFTKIEQFRVKNLIEQMQTKGETEQANVLQREYEKKLNLIKSKELSQALSTADDFYKRHLWEAAENEYNLLIKAGKGNNEILFKICMCKLKAHQEVRPEVFRFVITQIKAFKKEGLTQYVENLMQVITSKLPKNQSIFDLFF